MASRPPAVRATDRLPSVLIYRDLLGISGERFILNQAEALTEFVPYYVGHRVRNHRVGRYRVARGLKTPPERTFFVNRGVLRDKVRGRLKRLPGYGRAFVQSVGAVNPVLIHAHFGPDAVNALPLRRALNLPLLVTFRGYDATVSDEYARRNELGLRPYLKWRSVLQSETRLFLAVSQFIKERLIEQGFPEERIRVQYNGVDTAFFSADPAIAREPVVLFVGRMVEKKGCSFLIEAMAQVERTVPDAELVVIGDGALRRDLERLAKLRLPRFRFLGWQPRATVRAWMNRARAIGIPSVSAASGNSEGLPNVSVEAQAMGLPVVAFASAGIPEAVKHGETGFLVQPGNHADLVNPLVSLLTNDVLWRASSLAGRSRAERLFDLRLQTAKLEQIYREAQDSP